MNINKDWEGDKNSVFKTLGASNHSETEREENDFYATDPKALELLLELESFSPNIWECACGKNHLTNVLLKNGYNVKFSDIIKRCDDDVEIINFLETNIKFDGDILTNPPYKFAKEFVEKSLEVIPDGRKVIMFLKVQFLEGKARKILFKNHPPKVIYVSSSRLLCSKTDDFSGGSAVAYAWFIWEKGFNGKTIIEWFN